MFYKMDYTLSSCSGFDIPKGWDNLATRDNTSNSWYAHRSNSSNPINYFTQLYSMKKGILARNSEWIYHMSSQRKLIIAWNRVYDISAYYSPLNFEKDAFGFFGMYVKGIFDEYGSTGKDATSAFVLVEDPPYGSHQFVYNLKNCMNELFFTGLVDQRESWKCQIGAFMTMIPAFLLFIVITLKSLLYFVQSRLFSTKKPFLEKHTICFLPVFKEDYTCLEKSISSLIQLEYQKKLLFIVCDGVIIDDSSCIPSFRMVLDILGQTESKNYESNNAFLYKAYGEGYKQTNMAKIYSGFYKKTDTEEEIPFIVLVKVGLRCEIENLGNRFAFTIHFKCLLKSIRGKKDSQLLLFNFLNRIHYKSEMTPLEMELYIHFRNIIGIHPLEYEYIYMMDADGEVYPDSLKKLAYILNHDSRVFFLTF